MRASRDKWMEPLRAQSKSLTITLRPLILFSLHIQLPKEFLGLLGPQTQHFLSNFTAS